MEISCGEEFEFYNVNQAWECSYCGRISFFFPVIFPVQGNSHFQAFSISGKIQAFLSVLIFMSTSLMKLPNLMMNTMADFKNVCTKIELKEQHLAKKSILNFWSDWMCWGTLCPVHPYPNPNTNSNHKLLELTWFGILGLATLIGLGLVLNLLSNSHWSLRI